MSDVCDICKHYDTRIFPKLGPMVREIRATLESLLPSYFRALDKEQSLVSENPHAVSNPSYLQRLPSYVRAQRKVASRLKSRTGKNLDLSPVESSFAMDKMLDKILIEKMPGTGGLGLSVGIWTRRWTR